MRILNLYASMNGNTEKVATEVEKSLFGMGHDVETVNVARDERELELLEYDITFIGGGVYSWLPCKAMLGWIDRQMAAAKKKGLILPNSPRVPGKFVSVYATYAGPHTGEAEAVPAIKYMGQLFDHIGVTIASEWSVVGEFSPEKMHFMNTCGRLGNIEGRPNADDLRAVREQVCALVQSLAPVVNMAHGADNASAAS
ncbi:hypothetical protein [Pseudodesulfovibrio tunisiensis]|uniref:hypothetical protein n=1 Tax=Pseudodesulfovibrio tunisiensis TaxID=463192 RepID=UPI001FB51CDC|nr:hypothetical protein [Pseudodesulfovibrio tunisiensis]